jgi:hypothetical protein
LPPGRQHIEIRHGQGVLIWGLRDFTASADNTARE